MQRSSGKMKVTVTALLMICLTVCLLGSGGVAAKEKAKLKFWNRGSGADPAYAEIIKRFNASQNQVEVVNEFYGENYPNIVSLALTAGNIADIFEITPPLSVVTLAKQKNLLPVNDILRGNFKKNFYLPALKQKDLYYKNKLYSIPVRIDTYRLLYNKDLFKKAGLDPNQPPKTLEEMRKMAKQITRAGKGEYYGLALQLGTGNAWFRILDTINTAMGVSSPYGFDYRTGKFDFSTNKRLLEYYIGLQKDGILMPGSLTMGSDPMRAAFAQGKIGMTIDGSWMSSVYATQIKALNDWDAAPLPIFKGGKRVKDYAVCTITFAIAKTTKHPAAAKRFYKFFLENAVLSNRLMPQPKTYLPANKPENLNVKKFNLKGVKVMFNTGDNAPFAIEPYKFLVLEGDNRDRVFNNLFAKSLEGNVNIDSAIQDLNRRYNEALNKALGKGDLNLKDIKNPKLFKR
jgi:multiple sugar transport system substrate-binding protein